jgi:NADPH:quinone reductase-like Zn-dependent oxidoreductase/acyl carrier protein
LASALSRVVERKTPPSILFVFPDAAPDEGAIAELSRTLPVFRESLERHAGSPWATQLAYADVLRAWRIEPAYVTGEGLGELAAAVVAGALTPEEAVDLLNGRTGVSPRAPQIGIVASDSPRFAILASSAVRGAPVCDLTLSVQPQSWPVLLAQLAELYLAGVEIDWCEFDRPFNRRKVPLPTYPFQRERYWLETRAPRPTNDALAAAFPGRRLFSPALKDAVYESHFDRDVYSFVPDHQVYGTVVVAGACWVSMALSAAPQSAAGSLAVRDVAFPGALVLESGVGRRVQLVLSTDGAFQVVSCPAGAAPPDAWSVHATGKLAAGAATPAAHDALDEIQSRCTDRIAGDDFYRKALEANLQLGPQFQWIDHVWRRDGEALCRMRLARLSDECDRYELHPGLVDSCFQSIGAALAVSESAGDAFVPVAIGEYRLMRKPSATTELWCHIVLRPGQQPRGASFIADLRLVDLEGTVYAVVEGIIVRRAPREALLRRAEANVVDWLYEIDWRRVSLPASVEAVPVGSAWLVIPDRAGVAASLAEQLTARGDWCVQLSSIADLAIPDHCRGVLHCASLDVAADSLEAAQEAACGSALRLVQALAKLPVKPPLWIVTRGAQPAGGATAAVAQAPVWGLAKVVALEHPELLCRCVDLDPAKSPSDAAADLAAELLAATPEQQIAYRGSTRYAARLRRHNTGAAESVRLEIAERGVLDHLELAPAPRTAPGRGQIEIRVAATGLNFRDVLNAMGMYPGDAGPMGLECAGVVTGIGEGVTGFSIGDEVLAVAPGSFSRYALAYVPFVVPKPAGMSFADAATIPIAFLTAYHCLHNLAHISRGDRVLIHAAAGGVGLAAVQLAHLAGAEVFATAGSPEKQAVLRSLGVRHIAGSRTLDFADEFARATAGACVDIVFNSLAGDFIPKSFSLLRHGGRFLEIGKTGVWTAAQAAALDKDIAYFVYDLARQCQEEPEFVGSMLRELTSLFAEGKLHPLPLHTFDIEDSVGAFRFMQQARHIGKIVITQKAEPPAESQAPVAFDSNATYLIAGGTRGLGLLTAEWMVERGARHLVLTARTDPDADAAEALDRLRQRTATLRVERADAAGRDQMDRLLQSISASMPPLRGIVHSAGILDDGVILEQDWSRFSTVMAPKVLGSWNLHSLTRDLPLDFFVLYSSIVSVIGSPGQSNHTAANTFLDALAHYRRSCGLPALSINWGAWSAVGAAARRNIGARVRMQGMAEIAPADGLRVLDKVWHASRSQVGVLPVDWSEFFHRNPAAAESPFLALLAREARTHTNLEAASAARTDLLRRLESARPSERLDVLLACVQAEAAKVLGLDASRTLDPRRPLNELGLDSLMAVELRNALGNLAGRTLPVTLLFDYPTVQGLTDHLAAEAFPIVSAPAEPPPADRPLAAAAGAGNGAELSGEELLASFDRELASLDRWVEHH